MLGKGLPTGLHPPFMWNVLSRQELWRWAGLVSTPPIVCVGICTRAIQCGGLELFCLGSLSALLILNGILGKLSDVSGLQFPHL
jgi:uncharacterized membrane protein